MRNEVYRASAALTLGVLLMTATLSASAADPPALRVSDNGRFLVTVDGKPFFWQGDTAWAMIQKCRREDSAEQPSVLRYFENRAQKGFTVIQCRLTENGESKNAYGQPAFINGDFSQPAVKDGPSNDYWDHVDWVVDRAAEHGLYLAVLPIWAARVEPGHALDREPKVAYGYGRFLGQRYGKRPHLIWVLGGDPWPKGTDVDTPARLKMIRAMAEGIADGAAGSGQFDGQADYSRLLMTYHPKGGNHSSSEVLHNEPWLDFNMIQTTTRFKFTNYETVARDYAKQPPKPTLDGEVAYEWSLSLNRKEPQDRRTTPWEVRKGCYWDLFAGGFGHTYGHRSFVLWCCKDESLKHGANVPWFENLDAPGSFQVAHARKLLESHAFLTRVPAQSVIVAGQGKGLDQAVATRDSEGSFVMVYLPTGKPVTIRLDGLRSRTAHAFWFDPRTGTKAGIGEVPTSDPKQFSPPTTGEGNDWVLVVEA